MGGRKIAFTSRPNLKDGVATLSVLAFKNSLVTCKTVPKGFAGLGKSEFALNNKA